ncbi:arsenate reductase family protein [Defluviimonas sp. SAOS-178_SWC]|uniref:arsenate reductase family protein n=1 Tax=Defluviimonas sp. SAOS-178_SWC TaxID=3121287 RepID=UPI003221F254
MILYGLPTCDSCRAALKAIRAAGREVAFRDIRAEPLSAEEWLALIAVFGDRLVNRASTTWRGLSEEARAGSAADLLMQYPALMKRPVIRDDGHFHLGWKSDVQDLVLK